MYLLPSALVFKLMLHFSVGTIVALAPAAMSMKINTKTHVGIKEAKRRHKLLEVKRPSVGLHPDNGCKRNVSVDGFLIILSLCWL